MISSKYHKLVQVTFGIFTRSRSACILHNACKSSLQNGYHERISALTSQNYSHCKIFSRYASTIVQDVIVESTDNTEIDKQQNGWNRETDRGSFYHFLKDYLSKKNFILTSSDWEELEQQINMMENKSSSWETNIMNLILGCKKFSVGKSFLNYISKQNRKASYSTLVLFISLCGADYTADDHMESIILDTYQQFQQQLRLSGLDIGVYDSTTCRHLINGFSKTSKWKECMTFLDMASMMDRPGTSYISPIVAAAFRNGEIETALSFLNTMGARDIQPTTEAFEAFLLHCRHERHPDISFEDFSSLCNQYRWIPSDEVAVLIKEHFFESKDGKYSVKEARMSIGGSCLSCRHNIKRGGVSLDEFSTLQKEYMNKVMIGDNVYYKSNPEEFERFRQFLDIHAPFDVVIDGLNVAYSGGKAPKSTQLLRVAEYFAVDKKKKVCVIGRKHMLKWNKSQMTRLQNISTCFLADNISKDDQFVLYSTLKSGPYAVFVSIDEMRDSSYLLGEANRKIFQRWQASRQMSVKYITQKGQVILYIPTKYETSLQSDERGWHIPYIPPDDGTGKKRLSYQYPNAWICVRNMDKCG